MTTHTVAPETVEYALWSVLASTPLAQECARMGAFAGREGVLALLARLTEVTGEVFPVAECGLCEESSPVAQDERGFNYHCLVCGSVTDNPA